MQQLAAVGDRADCSCTRWLQIWITVEPGCSTAALVTAGNITHHGMGSGDWSSAAHTGEFPMGVGHRVENRWGLTKVAVVL